MGLLMVAYRDTTGHTRRASYVPVNVCMPVYTCIHVYLHLCLHAYVYTHACIHQYVCMHMHVCVYICILVYILFAQFSTILCFGAHSMIHHDSVKLKEGGLKNLSLNARGACT